MTHRLRRSLVSMRWAHPWQACVLHMTFIQHVTNLCEDIALCVFGAASDVVTVCCTVSGVTAQELYRQCRLKFLVTNEASLQAHVREFKDHGLLPSKSGKWMDRSSLVLALPLVAVENIMEKMSSWED